MPFGSLERVDVIKDTMVSSLGGIPTTLLSAGCAASYCTTLSIADYEKGF
jgi:hypothetical protein